MQSKIYMQRKIPSRIGITVLILVFSLFKTVVHAQSCQITQGQNGGVGLPVVSPVNFERGNSNGSKSHFAEGNSVPYRVEFTTLEAATQYKVRFGFDVKKNGKYAIDYITGFQNLQSTRYDVPETVLPIRGTLLEAVSGITTHSLPIPAPNFSSESSFNAVASSSFAALKTSQGFNPENGVPSSGLSATLRDKGNMVIWNGTLQSINYVEIVNTTLQTVSSYVEVVFTKANNNNAVVLAWGGHIASSVDWGIGSSASSISGSPYHMFVNYVSRVSDGNMICNGNMDCQLSEDAVSLAPSCAITGPGRICAETALLNYTGTLDAATNGPVNYQWTLTNLNASANATLSGATSGTSSNSSISTSVIPASPYFSEGGSFLLQLRVERDGIINYCYYNSPDSPGSAIHVNNIVSSAAASPTSFSLNSRSTSELSAAVLLDGSAANNDFSYQWALLNPGNMSGGQLSDINSRTPTFTASVVDTFNFKVRVTQLAAPNCIDSATVSVVVTPLQICPTVVTNAVCAGTIGNVYTASFDPEAGNSYLWSVNNGAQITSANGASTVTVNAGSLSFDLQLQIDYSNPDFDNLVCTYPVTVNPLPVLSTGQYSPVCASALPVSLDGLPSGGTWSGAGVNGNMFDPTVAGPGSHELIYTYTDANGCSSADTTSIVVNSNPVVEAGAYGPYCASSSPVTLSGSPAGGTWSGTGVSGSQFTASIPGANELIYTYTDANGCSSADTTSITVNANPVVEAGAYGPYCASSSPVSLSGSPAGGTWSGTGVSGLVFDPVDAGVGTHVITYTVYDSNGCMSIDTVQILVNPLPIVDAGIIDPLCSDTTDIQLLGSPVGGTWSGNGVTGSTFSPSSAGVGLHTLVYSYTDVNGCFNSDNVLVQVNSCFSVNACTYTQGYYGSVNGNSCDEDSLYNNAISLIRRLLSSGPIVIGSGNTTITILPTDSTRLNAVMPGGGTPRALSHTGNIYLTSSQMSLYKDSKGRLNNNLLSQTITLALNIRIKDDLAGFELENGYLHTQKLRTCSEGTGIVTCAEDSSAIKAWLMKSSVVNYLSANGGATVSSLLDLANAVLGKTLMPGQIGNNGTVVPTYADITYQIDVINNAFDKCRLFVSYLPSPVLCNTVSARISQSESEKIFILPTEFKVMVFPNPFQGVVNFSLESPKASTVKIELIEINGKMLGTYFQGTLQAGERKLIQVYPPKLMSPIIYRVTGSDKTIAGKLIPMQ